MTALARPTGTLLRTLRTTLPRTPRAGPSTYRFASSTNEPANAAGTQAMQGHALRATVEAELDKLRDTFSSTSVPAHAGWLRPLSHNEEALVNMGQVPLPAFKDEAPGTEIIGLIDIDLRELPFGSDRPDPPKRGDGSDGVHVPLLALAGTAGEMVPCYPVKRLWADLAPRVAASVRAAVKAQPSREGARAADDSALVAMVVPAAGESRDLAMPLAISLYRVAMHEGNGGPAAVGTAGPAT